ncbi:unnamed protein product [Schistocephalus solidus]|uniref:NPC1_N domain-containing protein n=1 Tax=Schistocephalus solidus TaxID=70667 RepID=A0A183TE52_SCHSO|nr:unnamed protein product [Schistocephalus solidus]
MSRGSYVHLVLKRGLLDELTIRSATSIREMRVQLHIDRMKILKGSAQCLWQKMSRVSHLFVQQPFVVAVFFGFRQPDPSDDFFGVPARGLRDPLINSTVKVILGKIFRDTPVHTKSQCFQKMRNMFCEIHCHANQSQIVAILDTNERRAITGIRAQIKLDFANEMFKECAKLKILWIRIVDKICIRPPCNTKEFFRSLGATKQMGGSSPFLIDFQFID